MSRIAPPPALQGLYNALLTYFFNPAMMLIFALGLMFFVWGFIEFLWNYSDTSRQESGKKHMLYGVVGMFVMVAAYAIVRFIGSAFSVVI